MQDTAKWQGHLAFCITFPECMKVHNLDISIPVQDTGSSSHNNLHSSNSCTTNTCHAVVTLLYDYHLLSDSISVTTLWMSEVHSMYRISMEKDYLAIDVLSCRITV